MTSARVLSRRLSVEQRQQLERLRSSVERLLEAHPRSVLGQIGQTPLLALPQASAQLRLWAKLESHNPSGSIKDRTVLYLLADALDTGQVQTNTTLVEASSGNTGIALAALGAALRRRVLIFMPENVSAERANLIRAYGARVQLTPAELGTDGAISAARKAHEDPGHYWLRQHENFANTLAHYDTTGAEILAQCPDVELFVASSGTTGTLVGSSMRIKQANPKTKVVAVWPEDKIMGLRRPEGATRPLIYDERWIDHIVEISDVEAKEATRTLARTTGLLVGPSSGAAWLAAQRLGSQLDPSTPHDVVVCFPDDGARYLSTDTFEPTREGAFLDPVANG